MHARHEDGDARVFRWAGLSETFSEIRDNAGNRQVVSREQTPIALKIGTESLVEKFVRFQEPRYQETFARAGAGRERAAVPSTISTRTRPPVAMASFVIVSSVKFTSPRITLDT
jgi:hypothetical protein